jgi:hypothetical protein
MRRSVFILFGLGALLATYLDASGWGGDGHRFINRNAVYHLPNEMHLFIQDSSFFAQHASDPDIRRVSGDTNMYAEGPRHYLDIDDYPNFQTLPRNLDTLIALYGWERVKRNGTLPWATMWNVDSLVNQLGRGDWTAAKLTASDIGHYVGDAHQPLHNTVNYNPGGLHSRYESTMLNPSHYLSQLFIIPDSCRYIADRLDCAFDYILHSNSLVDSLIQGDAYAKVVSGWNGSGTPPASYYAALWSYTREMTLDQMQGATQTLADFWYTAWVDAGLILPTEVDMPRNTRPAEFGLEQNFPNPFNPATTISYQLPVGGTVALVVYSIDGREVATPVLGNQSAGFHSVEFSARNLASGVYLYRLQLGHFSQTRKLVLLK